ncbi:MAG: hypothetical protein ABI557_20000, partial [Aureliella sp.]
DEVERVSDKLFCVWLWVGVIAVSVSQPITANIVAMSNVFVISLMVSLVVVALPNNGKDHVVPANDVLAN